MADGEVSLIVLPSTMPAYFVEPAVKVISAPFKRPCTAWLPSVPEMIWNVCVSFSSPLGVDHVPSTLAGTIQKSAVHQLLEQPSLMVDVSSAC
jgi:hypothetical protein